MASQTQSPAPATTVTASPTAGGPPPAGPPPAGPVPAGPASQTGGTPPAQPPVSRAVAGLWCLAAVVLVAGAAGASVAVARATAFSTAHRAAAAWTGLLVVVALAVVAQGILLWYQARVTEPNAPSGHLAFRRRGLKAAVIGQDGRASTSKTQVALWTAAVVWALVDLLLLARAYPRGNLFSGAVTTNWRPEYLVLLGLPVAAATAAKAAVVTANSGRGPLDSASADQAQGLDRVYVRDPVPQEAKGFWTGVAELLTGDDGAVAWADLQYVVFTLITLTYFAAQFLARPADGLPPVPAALLTLMGVSASAYTANKIVSTKGTAPQPTAQNAAQPTTDTSVSPDGAASGGSDGSDGAKAG
jgi:hypothetical protein